ncbi:MAG: hypothetical protein PUH03_05600 [bacterium]|nr:hypothetical protein [bacterium]MDY2829987.1 hypothetical protein [Alphaproteobacteria bacterium]
MKTLETIIAWILGGSMTIIVITCMLILCYWLAKAIIGRIRERNQPEPEPKPEPQRIIRIYLRQK